MSQDDTSAYTPMTPYYDTSVEPTPPAPQRARRRGPLSSRLEARARLTPLPESSPLSTTGPTGSTYPASATEQSFAESDTEFDAPSSSQAGPVWEMLTGVLRGPDDATEALREGHAFGARWGSRAEMLGACLDEYYQLTAKYNDARALLKETEQDLAPLRQQQLTSYMTLRELEAHLELHSRAELRAAYLGAAEIEMRVFRVEQERDLLSSQVETFEGFLGFLSRVISTIRTIPAEAMEQPTSDSEQEAMEQPAPESGQEVMAQPASDSGQEATTRLTSRSGLEVTTRLASRSGLEVTTRLAHGSSAETAAPDDADAFEEFVVDADEAEALAARGEVEVIGAVEEEEAAPGQPRDENTPE